MKQQDTSDQNTSQQPYESPRLAVLGTVASLTQGGAGSYSDGAALTEDSSAGGSGSIH